MTDYVTKIADVIVPELWNQYIMELTASKSNLIRSGVAVGSPEMNARVAQSSFTVSTPSWKDLDGDSEIISESASLATAKISAIETVAIKLIRGKAFAATDLVSMATEQNVVDVIAGRVADYWVREEQKALVNTLKGIFGSALASTHVLNAPTLVLDDKMILDGKQLLGDNDDKVVAIAMHSAVFTLLQKLQLIDYIPTPESKLGIPTYMGYEVIKDDALTPVDGVYTSYLFGKGAFIRGEGVPTNLKTFEMSRDALASKDIVVSRRAFVLHPTGLSFTGTVAANTPTNAELATANKWTKVYDNKNIPIVAIKHLVAAAS